MTFAKNILCGVNPNKSLKTEINNEKHITLRYHDKCLPTDLLKKQKEELACALKKSKKYANINMINLSDFVRDIQIIAGPTFGPSIEFQNLPYEGSTSNDYTNPSFWKWNWKLHYLTAKLVINVSTYDNIYYSCDKIVDFFNKQMESYRSNAQNYKDRKKRKSQEEVQQTADEREFLEALR
jgi:hypothetical protein